MIRLLALLPLLLAIHVGGFVREGAVEIDFPQAIRFSANLTIPASRLTSATLTITPLGQRPISVIVNLAQAAVNFDEPEARLVYTWPLPADNPPPLFGRVDYQWSFTASDGSVGSLRDSFVFSDTRFEWLHATDATGRFDITAPRSLASMIEPLQRLHALLEANTGRMLTDNLMLYDQPSGCGTAEMAGEVVGSLCPALFADYWLLQRWPDVTAEYLFTAALVQAAYAPLWDHKEMPEWFISGLVEFYQPSPKNALLPPVRQAARAGTIYSLAQMREDQSPTPPFWPEQSYGMVLYIVHQIGVQGLFDLARVDADTFTEAYEAAVGAPQTALIPAWRQWIFTRAAESDYGMTPYQPPTTTPSPTLTPSRTPSPTPTPTLTPSLTPTPTDTPRGVRTYVPPPTVTPSLTLTPPPPTVTPRPPGSLPTITATPSALQITVAQPGFQAGVGTFLVLLLVLLVYLTVRLGNRR